jgi:hypothetical protein
MWLAIAVLLCTLFALVYYSFTKNYNHWNKIGVRQVEPSFPLGTYGEEVLAKRHGLLRSRDEYQRFYDVPYYGIYFIKTPRLVIKDLEFVKNIFIKDFDHFIDRFPSTRGSVQIKTIFVICSVNMIVFSEMAGVREMWIRFGPNKCSTSLVTTGS